MNWNELDFSNVADWPIKAKALAIAAIALFVLGAGYFLFVKEKYTLLQAVYQKQTDFLMIFSEKQKAGSFVAEYEDQLRDMERKLSLLLGQLPKQTEVPSLVEDVSQQVVLSGLLLKSIKLQPETYRDFFVELPIELSLEGTYHQLGKFLEAIAALPRIVTVHDFAIEKQNTKNSTNSNMLRMKVLLRTYRYLSPSLPPQGDS